MSKLLSSSEKSDFRAVIKEIANKMIQKKLIQEDINEAAKGLADKYKDDTDITAAMIKKMAEFENNPEKASEQEEKVQNLLDMWEILKEKNSVQENYTETSTSQIVDDLLAD